MAALTDDQRKAINELTYDDAIADVEWGKQPADFSQYLQFDKVAARGLRRATDDDKVQFVNTLCNYLLDGELPNYDELPAVVAVIAEHIIETDQHSLINVFLTKYKQHMAGVLKGRQKAK